MNNSNECLHIKRRKKLLEDDPGRHLYCDSCANCGIELGDPYEWFHTSAERERRLPPNRADWLYPAAVGTGASIIAAFSILIVVHLAMTAPVQLSLLA